MAKLNKRQLYDYKDIDRGELALILKYHALWHEFKRLRARNGGYVPQKHPIQEALTLAWKEKQDYRAALKVKDAARSAKVRERFAKVKNA